MKKKMIGAAGPIAFLSLITLLLLFQNCSKTGFSSSELASNFDSSSSGDSSGQPTSTLPPDKSDLISAKTAGNLDSNCLNDSNYDACIFWKNPVAQRKSTYSSLLQFGTDLTSDQIFGVKLQNLKNPSQLTSNSLMVYYSGTDYNQEFHLPLNNGSFKQGYAADGNASSASASAKSVAQLMAYFWLDHLQTELKNRTGTSYSENSMTYVDAYAVDSRIDSSVEGNAFFVYGQSDPTDRLIVMGYASKVVNGQIVKAHEMALSAEVYIHEMGHANLHAAKGNDPSTTAVDSNGRTYFRVLKCTGDSTYLTDPAKNVQIYTSSSVQSMEAICGTEASGNFDYATVDLCKSNQGCFRAINEGQADFHSLMIFPDSTAFAETIKNNLSGGLDMKAKYARQLVSGNQYKCLSNIVAEGVKRNAALDTSLTVQQMFDGSTMQVNNCSNELPGEIHGMGSAYASILWSIYTNPKISSRTFEKAFQAHLQKLTGSTDFSGAWAALRADYLAAGGDPAGVQVIDDVFTRKGVNRPGSF